MKKIIDKREKARIREEAIELLRKTKAHLEEEHPALMKAMRLFAERTGQVEADSQSEAKPNKRIKVKPGCKKDSTKLEAKRRQNRLIKKATPLADDVVAIDREKNLEIVLRYAAANPNAGKLKEQLKDFLN